jgi:glucokinase
MARYVGVDVGATNLRAVVGDAAAAVLGRAAAQTPTESGVAIAEAMLSVVREACAAAGTEPGAVAAAGIGSIGPLDPAAGVARSPSNLPDTVGRVPLVGPLSELLGTDRVFLHNDTVAGVIGERFHSARNPDDMVYLTISSGIGAGVAVDGRVLSGWDGNAGEVGHTRIDPAGGMACGCGSEGHWEAYCSGENIPRYARRLHEREGLDTDLPVDGDLDASDVFAAAGDPDGGIGTGAGDGNGNGNGDGDEGGTGDGGGTGGGDPLADLVVERVAEWNAIGVANVVYAYAPIVIVVGGAVALNNPALVVDPIRERLGDLVMTNVPDVRPTAHGADVVVRGALASAITGGTGG